MEWQREVKIDAKIAPSRAIYDLDSNKAIVVTYYMDSDDCPFLKNKKCLIYNKKRAYICRLFPFNKGPFLKTGESLKKEDMFGTCPSLKGILPMLNDKNKKEFVNQLKEAFGNDFLNVMEYDYLTEWINKMVIVIIKPPIRIIQGV